MIRTLNFPRGSCALAALLLLSGSAVAWELGGPLYQRSFPNTMPPSWAGYPLDNPNPGYYGGSHYTEYYKFGYGYGFAGFPGPVPGPLPPPYLSGPPRHPRQPPRLPPGYVPTRELFPLDPVALLDVEVPDDADIWLEGKKTEQTGPLRRFISPALTPGKDYEYEIRASWQEDGREKKQTQTVTIRAGGQVRIRFPAAPPPTSE